MMHTTLRLCSACGWTNLPEFQVCLRCSNQLDGEPEAITDVTSHMYRTPAGSSVLILSPLRLEYSTPQIAFATGWDNVRTLTHSIFDDTIWLHRMPTFSRRAQFPFRGLLKNAMTKSISLRPFSYPANRALVADLARFGPQIRHLLRE